MWVFDETFEAAGVMDVNGDGFSKQVIDYGALAACRV
jgi:hypothetical protein